MSSSASGRRLHQVVVFVVVVFVVIVCIIDACITVILGAFICVCCVVVCFWSSSASSSFLLFYFILPLVPVTVARPVSIRSVNRSGEFLVRSPTSFWLEFSGGQQVQRDLLRHQFCSYPDREID